MTCWSTRNRSSALPSGLPFGGSAPLVSRPPGLGPESLRSRQAETGPRSAAERRQRSIQFGETIRGGRLGSGNLFVGDRYYRAAQARDLGPGGSAATGYGGGAGEIRTRERSPPVT